MPEILQQPVGPAFAIAKPPLDCKYIDHMTKMDYWSFVVGKYSLPQIVVDIVDIVDNIEQIGPIGMRMPKTVKQMQLKCHFVELFVMIVVVVLV